MRLLLLLVLTLLCAPAAPASADGWRWPLDGPADGAGTGPPRVSRPFVAPAHRYAAGHRGADLLALPGAAVRASGPGRVAYAGLVAGRGVVVVAHGALRTTYEPVAALVRVGTRVTGGQLLGRLEAGHPGCPGAACLHWGLRRGEDYLDPLRLVLRGPVRLLPARDPAPVLGREAGSRPAAPLPVLAEADREGSAAPASRRSGSRPAGPLAALAVVGGAAALGLVVGRGATPPGSRGRGARAP